MSNIGIQGIAERYPRLVLDKIVQGLENLLAVPFDFVAKIIYAADTRTTEYKLASKEFNGLAASISTLVNPANSGNTIDITRQGKPVAQLIAATPPRKPVDVAMLDAVTAIMPRTEESSGDFVRRMRDEDRY